MALAPGDPHRELIERRYGKANVTRLVRKFEEDQANKKWLDQSTMGCPSCHVKVEKSMGCNHVSLGIWRQIVNLTNRVLGR
jgi:E3 ubiquitin-protein ligase RNF14